MFDDCVIMAGGSGTRLWPVSNSKNPKQFLTAQFLPAEVPTAEVLTAEDKSSSSGERNTFLGGAVERAIAVTGNAGSVIIIAGKDHISRIAGICAAFDAEERKRIVLVPEPEAKNTAPAAACALVYALLRKKRNLLLLASDHIIRPLSAFRASAEAASLACEKNLVVFGVPPLRPDTGYGYIEAGEKLTEPASAEPRTPSVEIFRALSFREKPDAETAALFLERGRFYWNSGMFAFSPEFMREEFRRIAPGVMLPFEKLALPGEESYTAKNGVRILEHWTGLDKAYAEAESISFDYAVAEKCGKTAVIRAGFDWLDAGNWDEYSRLPGNTGSEVYGTGAASCFVDSDIPVALSGVSDLIVVIRSGRDGGVPSALIVKKGESQRVREAVEEIKKAGRTELL
jgi:mannose-1-phosphate guanylyltransferase